MTATLMIFLILCIIGAVNELRPRKNKKHND